MEKACQGTILMNSPARLKNSADSKTQTRPLACREAAGLTPVQSDSAVVDMLRLSVMVRMLSNVRRFAMRHSRAEA